MEHSYHFGDRVEKKILSGRLAGCWVPAQVIKVNVRRGTVNVCVLNHLGYKVTKFHIDVPFCYIRRSKYKFKIGDQVYTKILRGRKQGLWIPANIVFTNRDGTFDLLVEEYRTYLVTKYSMHVPEKYLIPADSSIIGQGSPYSSNESFSQSNTHWKYKCPESKSNTACTCVSRKFCGWDRELSKETKSSSPHRSITIDKSYINNLQLFLSHGQLPSEGRVLAPTRSITGEQIFPAVGRQSKLITRPLSVSIEPKQFAFTKPPKRGFKPRCFGNLSNSEPADSHSVLKPPFINTNSLSDLTDNPLSRESYEDLEVPLLPCSGQNKPLVNFRNQQKLESEVEMSQTRLPAVQKLFSDCGEQFEWSRSHQSPCRSPTGESRSTTMTDWDFPSPRKSGSPTDLSNNVSNFFSSARDIRRGSISSRYRDRSMSIGGKSTILCTPRSKFEFMASYLSQDQAKSFRKERISTIRVRGHNIKHKLIEMDTPLEELATWLSEGPNVNSGCEKREPKMVKMMSFGKKMIPIRSKIGDSMGVHSGKKEDYKLSDLVGKCVDSSKQGLAFFVGPVNGKLSYKISVFEKDNVNNMGRPQTNANSMVNSKV